MIDAEKLTKEYGNRIAVNDVSFHVEPGEIVGLLGPNGAGKTTTMRMLTGYIPATSGRAKVAGFDVADQPLQVRRHLGYLPETVPLYTDMTVQAYLDFTAKLRGVPGKDRKRRVQEVMEMCRVNDVAKRVIGKISRGYRQRVGLAQAIIHNPDVIILDEPTVGLDPRQIIEIRQVIRDLAGSHSMILSTHILPEVSTLCDRVIIINQGRVLVDDSMANLQRVGQENERLQLEVRGSLTEVEQFLAGLEGVRKVEALTKVVEDEAPSVINRFVVDAESGLDLREKLAHGVIDKGWGLLELKTAVPTLEEIFVKVISEDNEVLALGQEVEEDELDDEDEIDDGYVGGEIPDAPKLAKVSDDELDDLDDLDEEPEPVAAKPAKVNKKGQNQALLREQARQKEVKAAPAFLSDTKNSDDELDEPEDSRR